LFWVILLLDVQTTGNKRIFTPTMQAEETSKYRKKAKGKLLLLSLVHPDFLPQVYASAQTLRDEGCT